MKRLREVYHAQPKADIPSLKSRDRRKVRVEVELVNGLIHNLCCEFRSVTDVNRAEWTGAYVVCERLGLLKKGRRGRQATSKPWWQRRVEENLEKWRKDLSRIEEMRRGRWKPSEEERELLERRYSVTEKGTLGVSALLKSKIHAGSSKIRFYSERKVQYHQNNLFRNNQSRLYDELNGLRKDDNPAPDASEATEFWRRIWGEESWHDGEAEWLDRVRRSLAGVKEMDDVRVDMESIKAGVKRLSNCKAPGPDGVMGFWFKKLTSLHWSLSVWLGECMQSGEVPEWMVKGRTVLIRKDPAKGIQAGNYRPIACLPLMWKLLTGILAEVIYDHLKGQNLLPDEQKGCRKKSRGTKDQLLIDKAVLLEARRKSRCLAMAWVDYKKAYDMVPHSWLLEVMEMMGVAKNVRELLRSSMDDWRTELTVNGEELGEVNIKRGIFQGDSLSPLLFVMIMIPLTMILKQESRGYKFGSEGRLMNHLLFMDDLKLYAGTEKDLTVLTNIVQAYSRDIGMEFGMDKCAVLTMRGSKRLKSEGIVLPNGETMREVDEEGYKYLGVLEGERIKGKKMKERIRDEYLRRVRLLCKSKLRAANVISGINAWGIGVIRYTAGVLDWTAAELREMDIKTRKTLTLFGGFHREGGVDRLYLRRCEGGRGLISVEDCVRQEEKSLREYVESSGEWMLQVVREMELFKGKEMRKEYVERKRKERRERAREKPMHGKFLRETEGVMDGRTWDWLKGGILTPSTEAFVFAAQEQALGTRWLRNKVYGEEVSAQCRVCGLKEETVMHLAGACGELAKKQYLKRHDRMGLRVHWELCGKYGVERSDKWYRHVPESVVTSSDGEVDLYWNRRVETVKSVEHNRPDVVVVDRKERKWTLVDFAVPLDGNVERKEDEKESNYEALATEVRRMYRVRTEIVPVVIGALGTVPKRLGKNLERLGIPDIISSMQITALLGTQRILKNVLSL